MTIKSDIVTAVSIALTGASLPNFCYPDEWASIPTDTVPTIIVREFRAVANTTEYIASGCANHNWMVEVLAIVSREKEEPYPSLASATADDLSNDYEQDILAALLGEDLPDAVSKANLQSIIGWFQWFGSDGRHEPVYAVRVLLPVAQQIEF